ncbi:MAG TPA: hypothetical protein VK358_05050 [Longimicrobium sp.]|nr:hypothetical protein [Longimicrobium sp.]
MLEGLDDIDWVELEHAYGSAGNIPRLLRRLAAVPFSYEDWRTRRAGNAAERFLSAVSGVGLTVPTDEEEHPLHDLYGCLCHQGDIYSASVAAVPFLIELAAAATVIDRTGTLGLLADIATGRPYIRDGGEAASQNIRTRARNAVAAGRETYLALLEAPNTRVRIAAARPLSCFPEYGEAVSRVLRARLCVEEDTDARAALLLALAAVTPEGAPPDPVVVDAAATPDAAEVLRFLAALSLAWSAPDRLPDAAVDVLLLGLAYPSSLYEAFASFQTGDGDATDAARDALDALNPAVVDAAIDRALSAADTEADRGRVVLLWRAVLTAAPFNPLAREFRRRPPAPHELTPRQARVLQAAQNSDVFWRRNLNLELAPFALPDTRPALRAYLDG